jgi:hypothetical protein
MSEIGKHVAFQDEDSQGWQYMPTRMDTERLLVKARERRDTRANGPALYGKRKDMARVAFKKHGHPVRLHSPDADEVFSSDFYDVSE